MKRKDTRFELVDELRKLRIRLGRCPWLEQMIAEAKAGEYHDYKNQKYACGKVAVVDHLRRLAIPEAEALAKRVMEGEFDEEADEEDKEYLRSILQNNNMNTKGFRDLFDL